MECLKLWNGPKMPMLGMGTWHHAKSYPDEMTDAVKYAIDLGYRHIDCAYIYLNEAEVGAAFKDKVDKTVRRDEMFITSKLWSTDHAPDHVRAACQRTLDDLQLDYLDLYLIHWPSAFVHGEGNVPKDENGLVKFADVHYRQTWRALELLVEEGLVKGLGLSNFNSKQIDNLLESCSVSPAVLQVECNPRISQEPLKTFCDERDIAVVGFSPFGSPDLPWGATNLPPVLQDPQVAQIAHSIGRSPAQVILRWQIQRGVAVIPKSVIKTELEQNLKIFDFQLTAQQMATMNSLNKNMRKIVPIIEMPDGSKVPRDAADRFYPFNEPY